MLRSIAGGLGLLLIVVGVSFSARRGTDRRLVHDRPWTVAVTGVVMIAFGICLLAAARYRDRGPRR
jgi:hypothetical protein